MKNIIYAVLISLALAGCTDVKNNNISNIEPAAEVDGKFSTICLEGHIYYILKPTNSIAPKLSDKGKPVNCE